MIRTFACRETKNIFNLKYSKKFPTNIQQGALRIPPANRLEQLKGKPQRIQHLDFLIILETQRSSG